MNDTIFIINSLKVILDTYNSMTAFFYQKIIQTKYTNSQLAKYTVDYSLLLPSSQFIISLNSNQVNSQMQAYIILCNTFITYITTTVSTQTTLFYEQMQNQLYNSITQLNGFALALLQAKYSTIFVYKIPYTMSMSLALYNNGLDFATYSQQAELNPTLSDFNNILQNTTLTLTR